MAETPILEALRAELEAHMLAKPAMPVPFDPNSLEGRLYHERRSTWSDMRRLLEHEIWKLETPKTVYIRQAPTTAPRQNYAPAPVRLRR